MEKEKHVWTKGLFAFFLCISALSLSAQTITVRGIVTDRNNEPLIGVTIRVEGYENQGTVTDMDGKYMLVGVRNHASLVFSYVGMSTQTVEVRGRTVIDVILQSSEELLDEVVVVGYGTQKQGQVVSSLSTIKGRQLEVPSRSLTTTLAGRISGLLAVQRSGEPGYDNAEI